MTFQATTTIPTTAPAPHAESDARSSSVCVGARPPHGWDELVRDLPDGSPFHLTAWSRAVEAGLGWRTLWTWSERNGEVTGVLPLSYVKSRIFGARLVSSPQAAYGGAIARDRETADRLIAYAEQTAERLGVGHLELRNRADPGSSAAGGRWCATDLYVTIGGPIAADDDGILKAIPKKTRADCRKSDERGLRAEESAEHFRDFYELFAENQRDLGTPVLPRRFLAAVVESADLGARLLRVRNGCEIVASCLSLTWRDQVLPYWAGASAADMDLRPNHALYLNVLRQARRSGLRFYDFGRSKRGSGSYDFKKRWGFAEEPLHYRYRLVRSSEPPNLNPTNERYAKKIAAWKSLPLPVANLIGPFLSPGLS